MADAYSEFVASKLALALPTGISSAEPTSAHLFPFQLDLVRWALRRGRAAIFCATGLGKTRQQLLWCHYVAEHTGLPVLILAPLAVAGQTAEEGARIGIGVTVCASAADVRGGVNVTNYEKLHRFDPSVFGGTAFDESSIVKSYNSRTLAQLMAAFSRTPFRLALTATPSPNDFTELGTHAELLGICSRTEMLSEYFVHDGGETQKWRLKGHARSEFWKFVASWGALVRSPADLGYDASAYELPPLSIEHHTIAADDQSVRESGWLFAQPANSLMERKAARRGSVAARAERCAALVLGGSPWVGSQSTQKLDESGSPKTPTTGLATTHEATPPDRRTPDTCATTTLYTKSDSLSSGALDSPPSTQPSANATRPTPTIETGASKTSKRGRRRKSASDSGSESTSSPLSSTTSISPTRAAGAPSAAESPTNAAVAVCMSTTITPPDTSEECFAHPATSGSESLATMLSGSNEPWIIWCELNAEQNVLERLLGDECTSVHGALDTDEKERRLRLFLSRERRILITKPSVAGFGLNFQFCCKMAFVGVTDSWESYHQAVRRCYRFGQKRPVQVHVFASELEGAVVANLQRKEAEALLMAEELSRETAEVVRSQIQGAQSSIKPYAASALMRTPTWLATESEAAQ